MTAIGQDEARAALGAIASAKRNLSDLPLCPPWRHVVFALCEAALVASPALPFAWRIGVFVVVMAGVFGCIQSDRRRLGVFINGYRRGRTRRFTIGLLIGVLALYGVSVWTEMHGGQPAINIALAIVTFAVCYWGSVVWQRIFVREMREA